MRRGSYPYGGPRRGGFHTRGSSPYPYGGGQDYHAQPFLGHPAPPPPWMGPPSDDSALFYYGAAAQHHHEEEEEYFAYGYGYDGPSSPHARREQYRRDSWSGREGAGSGGPGASGGQGGGGADSGPSLWGSGTRRGRFDRVPEDGRGGTRRDEGLGLEPNVRGGESVFALLIIYK